MDSNFVSDYDGDGLANIADTDDDGDGVIDTLDLFPLNFSESADFDGDGIGDNRDIDDDNDGFIDILDLYPKNAGLSSMPNDTNDDSSSSDDEVAISLSTSAVLVLLVISFTLSLVFGLNRVSTSKKRAENPKESKEVEELLK
jgi:hypothetical protein